MVLFGKNENVQNKHQNSHADERIEAHRRFAKRFHINKVQNFAHSNWFGYETFVILSIG